MEVYDKIAWQVDGGIDKKDAISHFEFIFDWLYKKEMLSATGKELYEAGVDGSFSLSDNDLTAEGRAFISKYYDEYISKVQYGIEENEELLNKMLESN